MLLGVETVLDEESHLENTGENISKPTVAGRCSEDSRCRKSKATSHQLNDSPVMGVARRSLLLRTLCKA